jgi:hypothetical protein
VVPHTPDLDAWLPDPDVRTLHRRRVACSAEELWDAAAAVRLDECATLGRLIRWRIPGTPAAITFHQLFAAEPFAVLAEGPQWSVSGLVGKIWTLRRDYPRLDAPEDFLAWDASGTVRVAFLHRAAPDGEGGAVLTSEARVGAIDRWAGMRLRAVWSVLGRFETLIAAEPLTVAARRAGGRRPAPAPQAG